MRHLSSQLMAVLLLSVVFDASAATIWNVHEDGTGDAPFIQAAIDSSADGDSIIVWGGVYQENLLIQGKGLSFLAPEGPEATILEQAADVAIVTMSGESTYELSFEGFKLFAVGGSGSAFWIVFLPALNINNCLIEGFSAASLISGSGLIASSSFIQNLGFASDPKGSMGGAVNIYTEGPDPMEVTGCVFLQNQAINGRGGAIRHDDSGGDLIVRDCLFYGNEAEGGGAIWSSARLVELSGSTVVGNIADDGAVVIGFSLARPLDVLGNIFAENTGYGLYILGYPGSGGCGCNDWWQNSATGFNPEGHGSDWFGSCDKIGNKPNVFLNPLFCDPDNGNFHLDQASPVIPGNNPKLENCNWLGAFGIGCGISRTETTTWGQIKARDGKQR